MIAPGFPFDRDKAREALSSEETPALVLYAIIVAAYGHIMYGGHDDPLIDDDGILEPIEMWLMVRRDFGINTRPGVENKINAIRTAVETDAFYEDKEAFIAIVKAITEGDIDDIITGTFEDLSAAEIIMAMFEVSAVRDAHPPYAPAIVDLIDEEMREEAEDEETDAPIQGLVDDHKLEVQEWLLKLGADPKVVQNY